ncbi:hypothetical protein JKF63_06931 [Porcisia hertigi]|uniref:Uncharacterized protein n=1 Tax=Porcisia hertigi TaxID=2761500 RepID=A0A837A945_9TRYP|nr:hypothetical protein JKF63_06931 [Porcisia hertigi]
MTTSPASADLSAAGFLRRPASQRAAPTAAKYVASGNSRVCSVQQRGGGRSVACKEVFFAGFHCAWPCRHSPPRATMPPTTPTPAVAYPESSVRGFFERYGAVEALFYDEARGMGSVVFADGADAEKCYLAVHLSLIPAPDGNDGMSQIVWEQDTWDEALGEGQSRTPLLLLCLEFAHCCPFVNPFLLTRDASSLVGEEEEWEVPGGELSRALLLHSLSSLLLRSDSGSTATEPQVPVAPHVVVHWKAETVEAPAPRVEVVKDDGDDATAHCPAAAPSRRVRRFGPTFPGRGIQPAAVEEKLWQCLRPPHVPAQDGHVVTVMDLWWEYYYRYVLYKTQPSSDRIADNAFRYAEQLSLAQEVRNLHQEGLEYTNCDEAAARKVMLRLVHDNVYHSTLCYLHVKQKLTYDPTWASLMRDVYTAETMLYVQEWRATAEKRTEATRQARQRQQQQQRTAAKGVIKNRERATAPPPSTVSPNPRRSSAVKAAFEALHKSCPTKQEDTNKLDAADDRLWRTMSRIEAAANLIENVRLLEKIRRGKVDRNGHDKANTQSGVPPNSGSVGPCQMDIESAYPAMSAAQRDEQLYSAVMQNVDGYVATGTAGEMMSLCEDPKLFRYVKGHIGYEEAHRVPSYWRAYINALWVPLIALLLLGFGTYCVVTWIGINESHEKVVAERKRHEFHRHLLNLLNQQRVLLNKTSADSAQLETALKKIEEAMRRTSEAAAQAGGVFRIQLEHDL